MNTSTEHILQCNQSEPLADASGRIVDLMNKNDRDQVIVLLSAMMILVYLLHMLEYFFFK